jgi:hypothetical protein
MRSRILIYPKFQLWLLGIQCLFFLAVVIPVLFSVERSFERMSSLAMRSGLSSSHPFYQFIALEKSLIVESLWLPLASVALLSLFAIVWVSDRLAGPIVRLKRDFTEMKESGEFREIHFRKGDFFPELPEILNSALEEMRDTKKN